MGGSDGAAERATTTDPTGVVERGRMEDAEIGVKGGVCSRNPNGTQLHLELNESFATYE